MFELMHLRCFVAVAEELHFGRAAQRMCITQPPLSRQIQILERVLNVELFKRNSRSVELTAAGSAFLAEARRIIELAESAALTARRAADGEQGSLTLGFTAASGYSYIPQLIGKIRTHLPNVDLRLKEMVTGEQIDGLVGRRIDVGLLRPPIRRAEFESRLVLREGLLLCAPASAAGPRRIEECNDLPFIMYAPDGARYFHDLLTGFFANAGVAPRYVQYLSQIHSIVALVGAGLGYAIVPQAAGALRIDGVSYTPLEEVGTPVELHLVWKGSNDNPAVARLLSLVDELPA